MNKSRIKHLLLGKTLNEGLIGKILIYSLLIIIGFVYLYPIINMIVYSLKDLDDLVNPTVQWIPTKIYLENYRTSIIVLSYGKTLLFSLAVTLVPAILQTITCSFAGYALAKYRIKGKIIIFGIVLMTYLVPTQVYMIPRFVYFDRLGILESAWSIIFPATFGQGLSSAIFILIFYQFFRMQPKALDESAEIDGATPYQIFLRIGVPLAAPAYLTSFLFSFVWYWNETYISSLFIGNDLYTLQLKLLNFTSQFGLTSGLSQQAVNEAIKYSATILIILPVLIVYIIMQKWFVEGIDRTGITGE
ncbi:carbohydrate ABC transporter permease [Candidatus Izemoplasma sp. B36]|uniref:carbohydrate ABC transporter permease n=1 Tax=Candidatus Izemoplasma sp. B36 TaxID=3242468 RepID=UPI003556AC0C